MRVILKVLWHLVPDHARPFVDDVALKGPKSRYNDEEVSPGVRRFVAEHAELFARLLHARHGFRSSSSSSFRVFDRKFRVRSSSITTNLSSIEFELFSLLFDRVRA